MLELYCQLISVNHASYVIKMMSHVICTYKITYDTDKVLVALIVIVIALCRVLVCVHMYIYIHTYGQAINTTRLSVMTKVQIFVLLIPRHHSKVGLHPGYI